MKVGYQGVDGAFSSIAAKVLFPNSVYVSFKTFTDVLEAVKNAEIDTGVVPIENSYAGRVAGMHNLFKDFCDKKLFITHEKMLKIEHCLCGVEDSNIDDITHIFSHEQALMQCQMNISNVLPNAVCSAKGNTAMAAQFVSENNNHYYAAICSKDACRRYGLKILQENFQDVDDNYTLFVALSKKQNTIPANTSNVLTSMIFEIKNKSGSLCSCLECLEKQDLDLVKIESYIPTTSSTSAMFFATIRGNMEDTNMKKAVQNLYSLVKNIYIFGSYITERK